MTYAVHEHFHAFQGEGVHMGRAAWFVRLYGCNQRCPWCDAAGTWHPKHRPADLFKGSAEEVADLAGHGRNFAVVTGGEPTLYDLAPLVDVLHDRGRMVHLETAGHRPIRGAFDWVTLSPKPFGKPPLEESVLRADEFKIIVAEPGDIERGLSLVNNNPRSVPTWLHPEWSQAQNPEILGAICEAVQAGGWANLRAGWQLHKLYRVDQRDPNTRPDVPLGGQVGKSV